MALIKINHHFRTWQQANYTLWYNGPVLGNRYQHKVLCIDGKRKTMTKNIESLIFDYFNPLNLHNDYKKSVIWYSYLQILQL